MLLSPHFRFLIKRGVSKVTCTDAALLPRGCTDVICCVLLFLAIVGYVAVGIIGELGKGEDLGFSGGGAGTGSGAQGGTVAMK